MHPLTKLIREDMKPALGVTEPGAIAFAAAKARKYLQGEVRKIHLRLNSGMLKNAYTCGIPGCSRVGSLYAAALGALAADPQKGLECLEEITEEDDRNAQKLVEAGRVSTELTQISSRIFIEARVEAESGWAQVTIEDAHTHITRIVVNGDIVFSGERKAQTEEEQAPIHQYTAAQLLEYVKTVPAPELEFIEEAYRMNFALFEEGLQSPKTTFVDFLLEKNQGKIFSEDPLNTAALLCAGAIEARVIGLDRPAMSITGSGAHGIIATMPLYALYKTLALSRESLLRATALSFLICMYIKEYSGRLSAFCGCAIAAGTGAACGIVSLKNGGQEEMAAAIRNMASSITGMICDGGNQGCTMKGLTAVYAAFAAAELAMNKVSVDAVHGINGASPEDTMRYMGQIASPGMVETEKTILDIFQEKMKK